MLTITGNDTLILNDRQFADFADGDIGAITFPNNLAEAKAGKNGNMLFAHNAGGVIAELSIRVLLNSPDDKWLNSQVLSYLSDPAAYVFLSGQFIKRAGDGAGNVTNNTYNLAGGLIQKIPDAKSNVDGETEQSVAVYKMIFANCKPIKD
jgi:hypothetical protein